MSEKGFFLHHDAERGVFEAHTTELVEKGDSSLVAVSPSLPDILQKCSKEGFETFRGLTQEASAYIHNWLTIVRPAVGYVGDLWGSPSPALKEPIGFKTPVREEDTSRQSRSLPSSPIYAAIAPSAND